MSQILDSAAPVQRSLFRLSIILAAFVMVMSSGIPVRASDVELTLAGPEGSGELLELSLEELEAMPQVTIETENEFSDGAVSYRGPLVRDVLAQCRAGQGSRRSASTRRQRLLRRHSDQRLQRL